MKTKNGKLLKNIRLDKELYALPYKPVFFTLITHFKKRYFATPDFNMEIITCLKKVFIKPYCLLPVFSLMPDHLHFIVYLTEKQGNIIHLVNYFKSCSSKIAKSNGIMNLWQRRYFDQIIRKEESLKEISLYIYNNAKRRGLVENSQDYVYHEIKYDLLDI